jgi:hypothetical protein
MNSPAAGAEPQQRPSNPYVGPRAFERGEPLPARGRETRELTDLIIAERIVLVHAPSGAGKTSLLDAGVSPALEEQRFHCSRLLRVKTPAPKRLKVHNRYVFSVALDLLRDGQTVTTLAPLTLPEVVKLELDRKASGCQVLVFDQLEEILLIDPTDRKGQSVFFSELGEVLADGSVWAVLSIREDYMGGLDRFARYLPGHLSTAFRLDFLDHEAAAEAIQAPAHAAGVEFKDRATSKLIAKLATATVQTSGGGEKEVPAPYVQPVQLQVVCRKLWRSVSGEKQEAEQPFKTIGLKDVERHADIPAALRSYYAGVVAYAAETTGADEREIRRWFASDLITSQGYRSQTLRGPTSGAVDPLKVLRALEDGYLIRGDRRGDSTWFELAHDRLVKAVLDDNDHWLLPQLEPWQLAAREWGKSHDPARLLTGLELTIARPKDESALTSIERSFLDASTRAEQDRSVIIRTQLAVERMGRVAAFEFLVILALFAYIAWAT